MNLYNYRSATENIYNLSLIQLSRFYLFVIKREEKSYENQFISDSMQSNVYIFARNFSSESCQ